MLNIYMARHGEDEDNLNGVLNGRRDTNLTKKGVSQAKLIANNILNTKIKFDKIYSSPLKRTLVTANIISDKLSGPKPEILDELIERDFGIMTGKTYPEIVPMCQPDIFFSKDVVYFLSPEGAETFPQLIKRGKEIIRKIKNSNKEGNILLVTHGDIGKMIYSVFYDLDWKQVLKRFYFGNADMLLLSKNSSLEDVYVFSVSKGETTAQQKR